jgi:type IV secretory pathway VirB10-like protein
MRKRTLIVIGVFLAFFVAQGCTSAPEKTLLKKYFNAVMMNDNDTMSSMALEPFQPELGSWSIVSIGTEKAESATLPELNRAEIEAKKLQDAQIGPTIDADTALKDAQYEMDTSRTAAGKAAAKRKVDELQKAYDIENAKMQDLKKAYNAAKAAAAAEEEMTMFSLGARELPVVRDLTGEVRSKEVEVAITNRAGVTKNYKLFMRQYELRDEANNIRHPGRWVIIKFEPLS